MPPFSNEQVIAQFASIGVPIEKFFVVGDDPDESLIAYWHPEVGARYLSIEKDEIASACYHYLVHRGARRFASGDEIWQAAAAEKWPGWDTCADAERARSLGV
jgi:hypothetical protein